MLRRSVYLTGSSIVPELGCRKVLSFFLDEYTLYLGLSTTGLASGEPFRAELAMYMTALKLGRSFHGSRYSSFLTNIKNELLSP